MFYHFEWRSLRTSIRIDHPDYEQPLLLGTIARELTTEQIWSGYKHRSPVETNFFVPQDSLVENFLLNQRSVNKILQLQDAHKKKLGELLVEKEIMSQDKLQEILIELYTRHKGLLLTELQPTSTF